jgi:nucleoid-associated protein YgaU
VVNSRTGERKMSGQNTNCYPKLITTPSNNIKLHQIASNEGLGHSLKSVDNRTLCSDAATAFLILLLGVFLAASGQAVAGRWQRSAARNQSIGFDDLLGLAANILGLILVSWWVLSLLIAFAAAVLEQAGSRRAASATGSFAPRYMRRLALAALGLQLVATPLANAATPAADAVWTPSQGSSVSAAWKADETDGHPAQLLHPRWQPSGPVVEPGPLVAAPLRAAHQLPGTVTGQIAVVDGDSLWTIAASHLGPLASDVDIALEWPRWYQANRAVIGENPDELKPGQLLTHPGAA